jgi:hypothetical protein
MSNELYVQLSDSLQMSVSENVDHDTGIITYTVKGKRLTGTVTAYPRYDNSSETIPSKIFFESGSSTTENERNDILMINGIKIDCWKYFDLEGKEDRSHTYYLNRLGSYGWNTLPDATSTYAHKIFDALATLWSKRNDITDLMHAAARANASKRLQEEKDRAQELTTKLDQVRVELAASEQRAAALLRLQQEHLDKLSDGWHDVGLRDSEGWTPSPSSGNGDGTRAE